MYDTKSTTHRCMCVNEKGRPLSKTRKVQCGLLPLYNIESETVALKTDSTRHLLERTFHHWLGFCRELGKTFQLRVICIISTTTALPSVDRYMSKFLVFAIVTSQFKVKHTAVAN